VTRFNGTDCARLAGLIAQDWPGEGAWLSSTCRWRLPPDGRCSGRIDFRVTWVFSWTPLGAATPGSALPSSERTYASARTAWRIEWETQ